MSKIIEKEIKYLGNQEAEYVSGKQLVVSVLIALGEICKALEKIANQGINVRCAK